MTGTCDNCREVNAELFEVTDGVPGRVRKENWCGFCANQAYRCADCHGLFGVNFMIWLSFMGSRAYCLWCAKTVLIAEVTA